MYVFFRLEGELLKKNSELEKLESKARRERLTLENQLDVEKARFDAEKKKLQAQLDTSSKEKVFRRVCIVLQRFCFRRS